MLFRSQLSLSASVQYQGPQYSDVANSAALRIGAQIYTQLGASFSTLSSSPKPA